MYFFYFMIWKFHTLAFLIYLWCAHICSVWNNWVMQSKINLYLFVLNLASLKLKRDISSLATYPLPRSNKKEFMELTNL